MMKKKVKLLSFVVCRGRLGVECANLRVPIYEHEVTFLVYPIFAFFFSGSKKKLRPPPKDKVLATQREKY